MPFTLSASLFRARFTMRVGRARTARMARTRYTTLASQSVLRTHAYARARPSSSGTFLLHLSMLSLLPLLFDSAHGQSAYGYVQPGTNEGAPPDRKGKAREMHTSAASPAPSPSPPASGGASSSSSSSTLENHPPPPFSAYGPPAPSYLTSDGSSVHRVTAYRPPASHRLSAHQSASGPTAEHAVRSRPAADKDSPSKPYSDPTLPREPPHPAEIDDPGTEMKKLIINALSSVPSPSQLSNLTPEAIRTLPVPTVCELVHRTIISDIHDGNSPFATIDRGTVTLLLGLADPTMSEKAYLVLQTAGLWEAHSQTLALLREEDVHAGDGCDGSPLLHNARDVYFESLTGQVFDILETVLQYNLAQEHRRATPLPCCITSASHALALHVAQALRDPHKATLAWLSRRIMHKPSLDRQEIDSLLYESLPAFNEFVWPMVHSSLDIGHLRTIQDEIKHTKAVQAYAILLEYAKIHTPSKRYVYDILLQMMIDLPLPPDPSIPTPGADGEAALTSVQRHEELFKSSHSFLLEILQGVLNTAPSDGQAQPDRYYRISYVDNAWILTAAPAETVKPGSETSAALKTISRDIQSLVVLLKYAYRHLRSPEIGQLLYSSWIERALQRRRANLPEAQVDVASLYEKERAQLVTKGAEKYVRTHQYIDAIRIREATLLQENELVESLIEQSINRIASDAGWPEYTPPDRPRRLNLADSEKFEAYLLQTRKHWQIDVLLRCTDVENMFLTAVISYWTATGQSNLSRYFMNYFFQMIRQAQVARVAGSDGKGKIRFVYPDLDSLPPTGIEMDLAAAIERSRTMLASPEILVNTLNAAEKMGNLSLVEKCWLILCEEEDRRRISSSGAAQWKIPVAAYTLCLEAYASEAAAERQYRAEERRLKADSITNQNSEATYVKRPRRKRLSHQRSRITAGQRSKSEIIHQKACLEFASSIYHRFADNHDIRNTDARFFNAALDVFGGHTPQAMQAKLDASIRYYLAERRERGDYGQEEGSITSDDSKTRNFRAPGETCTASDRARVDAIESESEFSASNSDSGFGSDTRKRDITIKHSPIYQFLEVVLQDIKAAGFEPPEWTKDYLNPDRAGLIARSWTADRQPVIVARKASPLVRWTEQTRAHTRDSARFRIPVAYDRSRTKGRTRIVPEETASS